MLSLSIAGIGSAWMGGCARIPFVAASIRIAFLMVTYIRANATPYAALIRPTIVSRFSSS